MRLLLVFILVPLVEIALFIQVGGAIGMFFTLAIVVITAILGTYMMRSQGAVAVMQIRSSFQSMSDPSESLAHGSMILFASALLLTPGFFTDALGFALLVPAVRRAIFTQISKRMNVQTHSEIIIEGEYSDITPKDTPSGWTKH